MTATNWVRMGEQDPSLILRLGRNKDDYADLLSLSASQRKLRTRTSIPHRRIRIGLGWKSLFRCPLGGCLGAPERVAAIGAQRIALDANNIYWTSGGSVLMLPKPL